MFSVKKVGLVAGAAVLSLAASACGGLGGTPAASCAYCRLEAPDFRLGRGLLAAFSRSSCHVATLINHHHSVSVKKPAPAHRDRRALRTGRHGGRPHGWMDQALEAR